MATNDDGSGFKDAAFRATLTSVEIAGLYVPFINMVKILIDEVKKIYEDAECNKEICLIMVNRVAIAECAMNEMLNSNKNESYFRKCFVSFKRFEIVLKNIKDFTNKVSKIEGYRKFLNAPEIKKKFDKLIQEYDICMKELHFTMAIASESQRNLEAQKVDNSLKNVEDTLKNVSNQLDVVVQGINILRSQMDGQSDNIHVPEVHSSHLSNPYVITEKDIRGSETYPTVKKFYKNYVDVACKCVKDKSHDFKIELAILGILGQSQYILHFYGLSNVDNRDVMVFDWADHGTLKELYSSYDIPWTRKIRILRDICRGLVFLRSANVFHHDMRCENIFVLHNLDSKIGNFKCARKTDAKTRNLEHLVTNIIRWMAPEQIKKYKDKRHEDKNFGMLIWELCYEKMPYEKRDIQDISNHVLNGNRERLLTGQFDDPDDKEIQEKLIKIIKNTWKHIPHERISITDLHRKLEKLAANYPIPPGAPVLLEDKSLNFDGSLVHQEPEGAPLFIPLDRGIELHKKRDHVNAWKCFNENADLGDNSAKYWQGYYLCHGYGVVEKNERRAMELFKEAADNDHPDAQYRYAMLSLSSLSKEESDARKEEICKEILHYFKLAANSNKQNYDAVYYLGDIYLNGKLNVEQNRELGLNYLNLAAGNGHTKATKLLKETTQLDNRMDVEV
ncbi:7084_t:CDS:2 [Gigaspora margarita]|uniref:7084_t:CDS:1 n=1 Tax=Gigaspora margarita TaxID=4874 RepID=A0ABN7UXH7_GIGMA|nr:7084_t:CDS:2 [Gigaspora margarita]